MRHAAFAQDAFDAVYVGAVDLRQACKGTTEKASIYNSSKIFSFHFSVFHFFFVPLHSDYKHKLLTTTL